MFTLTTPSAPILTSATPKNPSNCVTNKGAIAITATAGSSALQYSINGGGAWLATNNNTSQSAGIYSIAIRNTGGTCSVLGTTLTLSGPSLTPTISYGASSYCNNATITTTSGTNLVGGLFRTTATGITLTSGNGNIAAGATAGVYAITYTIAGSSFCTGVTSAAATVTIVGPATAGAVSGGSTPITLGVSTGTMNLTGNTGNVVNWQVSYNSGTYTNITTATGTSYSTTPTAIGTYDYRVVVSNGICANVTSTGQTINVIGTTGAVIGGISPLCINGSTGPMTLTGAAGTISNWEYSPNNGTNWFSLSNTTTLLSNFTVTVSGTYQFRISISGVGTSVARNIQVDASPVAGTLSPIASTVCSNANAGTITLTGTIGTINNWKSSGDGGTSWTNISNTTSTQSYTNLTQSTQYKAEVSNGVCQIATTTGVGGTAIITVDPAAVGGSVSGGTSSISLGSNTGTMSVSSNVGTIIGWQRSYNNGTLANVAGAQATYSETPLAVGTYEYRAIIQSGVCATVTSTINQTITVTGSAGIVSGGASPICMGGSSGVMTLTGVAGAIAKWQYSTDNGSNWNDLGSTAGATSYSFVNLNIVGTWKFRASITGVGFSSERSISVDAIPSLNPTTIQHITNCGLIDGQLTINATGGTGILEYGIMGGSINPTGIFSNLNATTGGIYFVRNVASPTCSVTSAFTITTPSAPLFTSRTIQNISNCGFADAGITITGTAGSGAMEYSKDGGATYQQGSNVYSGISTALTGVPMIRTVGYSACTVSGSAYTITAPSAPTMVSRSVQNISNCGGSDGAVTLTGTGGSTLEYSINGTVWSSSSVFTFAGAVNNLTPYAREAGLSACSVSGAVFSITAPNAPSLNPVAIQHISNCGQIDGQLTINATGGTPPFTYGIIGGTTNGTGIFSTLNAITGGTYFVRNSSSPTCSITGVFTITTPSAPSISSSSKTDVTGCSLSDGTVAIIATGGTGTLQYSVDGSTWQLNNAFTGLAAGTKTPQVRNQSSNACSSIGSVLTIAGPIQPSISSVTKTDITACGLSDGAITIVGTGGTGSLQYSINNGTNWQTSNVFTGLSPATGITPKVRNQNTTSCEATYSPTITINAPSAPVVGVLSPISAKICVGGFVNLGLIDYTGTIQWQQDGANVGSGANTYTTGALSTNTTIKVTLSSGSCTSVSEIRVITVVSPPIQPDIKYTQNLYCKENTPSLTPSSTFFGGEFSVTPGITLNPDRSINLSKAEIGKSYTISYVVTPDGICTAPTPSNFTITVTGAEAGTLVATNATANICQGSDISLELQGSIGFIVWEQSDTNGSTWTGIPSATGSSFSSKAANAGTIQYRSKALSASGTCVPKPSNVQSFSISAPTKTGIVGAQKPIICDEFSTQVSLKGNIGLIKQWESTSDTSQTNSWTQVVSANSDTIFSTPSMINYGQAAYFRAKVQNGGCEEKSTNVVKVEVCKQNDFTPNALTPSTADQNSVWMLDNLKLTSASMVRVFNRYGTEVYQARGDAYKANPWDGGGLPAGTYYYVINRNDGQTKELTGAITIIK